MIKLFPVFRSGLSGQQVSWLVILAAFLCVFGLTGSAYADLQSTLTTGLGKYEDDIVGSIQKVGVIAGGVMMTGLCVWLFFAQEKKKVFVFMGFVILGLVLMGLGTEVAKVFSPT